MARTVGSHALWFRSAIAVGIASVLAAVCPAADDTKASFQPKGKGWIRLFNGKDLSGWNAKEVGKHWRVVDGVIDCHAELGPGPSLRTNRKFSDFVLHIEWRIRDLKGKYPMKIILPDGSYKKDANGKDIVLLRPNADSGIYLRGTPRGQINIWCWPCGSGELWAVRNDRRLSPAERAAAVPKVKADKPIGEWNAFDITLKGDRVTVVLNGKKVIDNARVPGLPPEGPIVLQHHGGKDPRTGRWNPASSLVQFRNIWIKPLR